MGDKILLQSLQASLPRFTYNLANEENSPPDLATARLPPTEHGRNCEHQQYFGEQTLPIVQNYWRRQQALEEARAAFTPY